MGRSQAKVSLAVSVLSGTVLLSGGSPFPFVRTALAACDNLTPGSNQTATCASPGADPVVAQPGSTNVTVTITPTGGLTVPGNHGVQIRGQSQVINSGAITVSGVGFHGIVTTGNANTLTNNGTVTASGAGGFGVLMGGSGTLTNNAGATISSQLATGVVINGIGTVVNNGTITGSGGPGITFNNNLNGNSLTNSGTINGNGVLFAGVPTAVQFGAGRDRVTMLSGDINGHVDQGDGIDDFTMSGGTVRSLDQSGELDTFTMSGGRIIGGFYNGDFVTMTGGRIGFVELNQANNVMTMSGGTVDGDVTATSGNDTLRLSGGAIGGQVRFGSGNNVFEITGGSIGNGILTTFGADTLTWDGGGTVTGAIALGLGNDTATLRNLTPALLAPTTLFDGGAGTDTLTFDRTEATGVGRFQNWEAVNLTNGSRVTLDTNLRLGDAGTLTGTAAIDATSTLFAGNGVNPQIQSFSPGQLVTVTNAGTIDLTNGGAGAANSLTVVGNYVGNGGRLNLRTVLGADGSASDKLVISGGAATGNTGIGITNLGGSGALTLVDGIMVVQAVNGGSTASGAFGLAGPVAAGAFEYFLFKSGVTAGTTENWYLRSTLVAPPPVPPGDPVPPPPEPAPGTPPLPPAPPPGAAPIVLYRPEVALQSAVPPMALHMGLAALGTFHERQGEQAILTGNGQATAMWGRVYGQQQSQSWQGTVSPSFSGSITGIQAGFDLYAIERDNGHRDRFGVFAGYTRAEGRIRGYAIGFADASVGRLGLDGYSLGAYWTHLGPTNWYIDSVLMATLLNGRPASDRGIGADVSGRLFTASVEAGYPIPLGAGITLEPQAQLIWQHLSFDRTRDAFSTINFGEGSSFTGRIGGRLTSQFQMNGIQWMPYLRANLWHDFSRNQNVAFDADLISTTLGGTSLELGGGLVARVNTMTSLYASADYTTGLGSRRQAVKGRLGLRITW
ncbi:autotransporter outer membrane beta-barrel domain-containing protein [Phreatobacter stygius]|uniref:Autotransporter outer membrane beta-barrel domain-containing protein n=1 Tax=Phreatobacter stygius TaxID=1940610 RepID=A0A4D7AZR4_9HYPH|nr:autotransporter outer membrane beta-barrel domain-containing protein [Phreatobacter stygius]QCI66894.1 autotransporter outer membrane beta-barrel domain-containing protein [Phreatobacter stygius]